MKCDLLSRRFQFLLHISHLIAFPSYSTATEIINYPVPTNFHIIFYGLRCSRQSLPSFKTAQLELPGSVSEGKKYGKKGRNVTVVATHVATGYNVQHCK